MFGLHKYLNRIYEIKWYFPAHDKRTLEQLLYVEFTPTEDYFLVTKVHYTYVDILLGLEDFDFTVTKSNDDIKLRINKI